MNFLTDQDVYGKTVRFLAELGHNVLPVAQIGLNQAEDVHLLRFAQEHNRIFVTRDRDFGGIVFIREGGPGVIYLRMLPSTQDAVHVELERALHLYDQDTLRRSFLVVEPGRHRIRVVAASGPR